MQPHLAHPHPRHLGGRDGAAERAADLRLPVRGSSIRGECGVEGPARCRRAARAASAAGPPTTSRSRRRAARGRRTSGSRRRCGPRRRACSSASALRARCPTTCARVQPGSALGAAQVVVGQRVDDDGRGAPCPRRIHGSVTETSCRRHAAPVLQPRPRCPRAAPSCRSSRPWWWRSSSTSSRRSGSLNRATPAASIDARTSSRVSGGAGPGHDVDADPLAQLRVGHRDGGHLGDGGQLVDEVLDLLGGDLLAAAVDHVLVPALDDRGCPRACGGRCRRCGTSRPSVKARAFCSAAR